MKEATLKEYSEDYYQFHATRWISKFHIIRYIQFLLKQAEIKWLDIGCSRGYLIQELLQNNIQPYGIDISLIAFKDMPINIRSKVSLGSISYIPYKNETFDVISVFDVIEHIHPRETKQAFQELNRVLKKRGFLILTTPNCAYIGDWIHDLTHINVRPLAYWIRMFRSNGLKVKKEYVPSFLKYYVQQKYNFLLPIQDKVCFFCEEPLRYMLGKIFSKRGRLYFLAKKT